MNLNYYLKLHINKSYDKLSSLKHSTWQRKLHRPEFGLWIEVYVKSHPYTYIGQTQLRGQLPILVDQSVIWHQNAYILGIGQFTPKRMISKL